MKEKSKFRCIYDINNELSNPFCILFILHFCWAKLKYVKVQ